MDVDALVQLGWDTRTTRSVILGTYVAMLWDHILTFAEEVDLVWKRPKNIISIIFLINRYLAHIVIIINIYEKLGQPNDNQEFCKVWLWIDGFLQTTGYSLTYTLIALRVCAIWERRQGVNWSVAMIWVIQGISTSILAIIGLYLTEKTSRYDPTFKICRLTVPRWFFWVWVPSLIAESILLFLTALKGILDYKTRLTLPLAKVLYYDGFLYFFIVILCIIFNIVAWTALSPNFVTLAKYSTQAITTMMGSKIVLRLKTFGNRGNIPIGQSADYELEEFGPATLPTAHFVMPAREHWDSLHRREPLEGAMFDNTPTGSTVFSQSKAHRVSICNEAAAEVASREGDMSP